MRQPNLKKNYLYRVFYEVLILITPFITTPYVSRVLGADGVGDYSYTHSIITYFMLFGALGTIGYGTREIAQHREDKYKYSKLFWEIELMTVITSSVCLLAWFGVILFSSKFHDLYIALTPFLLSTMFDISWFFTGLEKIRNIVIRNTAIRILSIICLFVLVKEKNDLIIYCLINSLAMLFGNLSMWFYLPSLLTKISLKDLNLKNHFHETLIYFVPTIATSIYTVLDKTLIGAITGSSYQNGYYEQATKIIKIVKSVVFVAVNSVMGARISYLFSENKFLEIRNRIARSMDFIYLLAFGSMFGIVSIAPQFVPVFFGKGYDPVVSLLYCMVPLVIIVGTSNCLGSQYFTPSGQRKRSAKVIVFGAIINLVLNILLIPRYESYGATIASVIAESIIAVFYINMSNGFITWRQIWYFSYKRIIAGIFMTFIVRLFGRLLNLEGVVLICLQVIVGCLVYGLVLLVMNDKMLKQLINMVFKTFSKLLNRMIIHTGV